MMNEFKVKKTMADRLSNAYHSNPIARARIYLKDDLKFKRELRGTDTKEELEELRLIAGAALAQIKEITGIAAKVPKIVLTPRAPGGLTGYFYAIPNKVYLLHKMGKEVISHELVHYFRAKLEPRKIHKIREGSNDVLKRIIDEGVADFVGIYIKSRSSGAGEVEYPMPFKWSIKEAVDIYNIIRLSSENGEQALDNLTLHMNPYYKKTSGGKRIFKPYYPGNALAQILLAANGLDPERTAREMLTTTNEGLLGRLTSSIASDNGEISEAIFELRRKFAENE